MTRGKIKRTSVAIAATLVLGACSPAASAPAPHTGPITVAGAIRPTPDGEWHLVVDDTHQPRGVEDVRVDEAGNVVVEFSDEGSAVVTFVATVDESLTERGYAVGASVGLDRAELSFEPALDYATLGDRANVWVYGILEPAA